MDINFKKSQFVASYEITTTTDEGEAKTDEAVFYTIIGNRRNTSEFLADNEGNDRESGATDTYTITDNTDIGEFRCVSVRMNKSKSIVDDWKFKEVDIIQVASNKRAAIST